MKNLNLPNKLTVMRILLVFVILIISFLDIPGEVVGISLKYLIIDIIYYRKHQAYWIWDTTLLVLSGALGLIFFIMIFSQHPCVSLNTIILFFNPLPFLFLHKTIQKSRRQEYNSWWLIWGILITLGFIGTIFQYVPSPARIMALSLLIHCIIHLLIDKPTSIRPGSNK